METLQMPAPEAAEAGFSLTIDQIKERIPHRYPFLLVDRVVSLVPGKTIHAYKNVSVNEEYFNGHFPQMPIMPGVLQIEALAQTGAILTSYSPVSDGKIGVLAGVDGFRFRRMVKPGDRLDLFAEIIRLRPPIGKAKCWASCDGELVLEGEIMFSFVDPA